MIYIDFPRGESATIPQIALQGEYGAHAVRWDLTQEAFYTQWPSGHGTVWFAKADSSPWPLDAVQTDDMIEAELGPTETAETGMVKVCLVWAKGDTVLAKTRWYWLEIGESAYGGSEPGEPASDWLAAIASIQEAAETAAEAASDSESNAAGSAEEADAAALDAEAWAVGTRDGVAVDEEDAAYHNNAKYYAELAGPAAETATAAAIAATNAKGTALESATLAAAAAANAAASADAAGTDAGKAKQHMEDAAAEREAAEDAAQDAAIFAETAEAWAKGTNSGVPVTSGEDGYQDNAKYYAEQAGDAAEDAIQADMDAVAAAATATAMQGAAKGNAEDAEAWAVGTRDGVDVDEQDDAYHNNAKYYAEQVASNTEAAEQAAERAEAASAATPIIQDGTWRIWDTEQESYVDTGISATGPKGDAGSDGIQGPQGLPGEKGETGEAGRGIVSIEKTGDEGLVDFYTVLYTDGTSDEIEVHNGEKGEKGDPGEGVAPGGTTGQMLVKKTDTDYDTEWVDQPDLTNVAQQDGSYEAMTAGNAEQLLSRKTAENAVPYKFRATPENADREYLDAIVGGTVAWNQLVKNGNFADGNTGWGVNGSASISASGGKMTVTATGTNPVLQQSTNAYMTIPTNHVLFVGGIVTPHQQNSSTLRFRICDTASDSAYKSVYYGKPSGTAPIAIASIEKNTLDAEQIRIRIWLDYTSATVGDSYTVENIELFDLTQMLGSTIADYLFNLETATPGAGVAWFRKLFPEDYYEYNPGELISVEGVSAHVTQDANGETLESYPLDDSLTLRGVPKLDSNNKLYYDGDTYESDGTVTRRYRIVDLGTLDWYLLTDLGTYPYFAVADGTMFFGSNQYIKIPGYNDLGSMGGTAFANLSDAAGYSRGISTNGRIFKLRDTRYADLAAFKAGMSGVMMLYELKTPTTETADPFRNLQICDPDGTEEFVSTSIVPVGHETRYPENLRAKIEGLPWNFNALIAMTETTTTASKAYAVGDYFILNNVLYRVASAIASGGTITPGTNAIATTIMDEIKSLA